MLDKRRSYKWKWFEFRMDGNNWKDERENEAKIV